MNERIKDLLPNPFAVDYQYKDGPLDLYTEKEMIRFAELIIEEMYDFIMEESSNDNGIPDLGKIKKHFGVEEVKVVPIRSEIKPHTCPYKMEIYGDFETLCICDAAAQHECAMDV